MNRLSSTPSATRTEGALQQMESRRHSATWDTRSKAWSILTCASSGGAESEELRSLLREPMDWNAILELAEEHGVVVHLAEALRDQPGSGPVPREILEKIQQRRRRQTASTLGMAAELFRLLELFETAGIPVLAIKGPVLSMRAYGDPGFRQYGDLDFLVRSKDVAGATRILETGGYHSRVSLDAIQGGRVPGEYLFRMASGGILVELHTEKSLRYFPKPLPIDEYFARQSRVKIDARAVPAMSAEDEFVHACIHGSKHVWERLAWIADVAALLRNGSVDVGATTESARRVGALRMLMLGATLAAEVLHVPVPRPWNGNPADRSSVAKIAAEIVRRLPSGATGDLGIWRRAAYRVATGGGGMAGLFYFGKLTCSTTEKDWLSADDSTESALRGFPRRLRRLAKLYGHPRRRVF